MKNKLKNLAIFGGPKSFDEPLHVGRPNICNRKRFFKRIDTLLSRRWLTNRGPYVKEFENKIAEVIGVRHCIAMCNATVALEIAVRAVGMSGEVILPSMTFIATAHSLQWQQIRPVFCDINPANYTIAPERIEDMITPRTTGIIGVHLWERPCEIGLLTKIARQHRLKLIFDAAHAFGCTYKGEMIGNFGDAEVFSFHATKFFNTFEGGAVVTNNDDLADKIRLMKNFGFAGRDNVIYIGTNGKMSEISAAMGLTSLESLDDFIGVNYRNYLCYQKELADIPGIKLLKYDETEKRNYQYIVIEVDKTAAEINRDQLMKVLHAENILARRYFYPGCHRMEPYRSYYPHTGLLLPETEKALERVLSLPTGTAIGLREIRRICEIIRIVTTCGLKVKEKVSYFVPVNVFGQNNRPSEKASYL